MSSQQFPPASDPHRPFGAPPPTVQQSAVPFAPSPPPAGRRTGLIAVGVLLLAAGVAAGVVMFVASGTQLRRGGREPGPRAGRVHDRARVRQDRHVHHLRRDQGRDRRPQRRLPGDRDRLRVLRRRVARCRCRVDRRGRRRRRPRRRLRQGLRRGWLRWDSRSPRWRSTKPATTTSPSRPTRRTSRSRSGRTPRTTPTRCGPTRSSLPRPAWCWAALLFLLGLRRRSGPPSLPPTGAAAAVRARPPQPSDAAGAAATARRRRWPPRHRPPSAAPVAAADRRRRRRRRRSRPCTGRRARRPPTAAAAADGPVRRRHDPEPHGTSSGRRRCRRSGAPWSELELRRRRGQRRRMTVTTRPKTLHLVGTEHHRRRAGRWPAAT